ncbi:MAG: hypothetical protein AAGI38_10815 [Bacteroidota bacterium]
MSVAEIMQQASGSDIFESDEAFVSLAATALVVVGLVMLLWGLSCYLAPGLNICGYYLVSFPYLANLKPEFVSINLPLGTLIIGIGLQLYTRLGWIISMVLVFGMAALFGSSAVRLWAGWLGDPPNFYAFQELIVNTSFTFLCLIGLVFLLTSSVRKLYR